MEAACLLSSKIKYANYCLSACAGKPHLLPRACTLLALSWGNVPPLPVLPTISHPWCLFRSTVSSTLAYHPCIHSLSVFWKFIISNPVVASLLFYSLHYHGFIPIYTPFLEFHWDFRRQESSAHPAQSAILNQTAFFCYVLNLIWYLAFCSFLLNHFKKFVVWLIKDKSNLSCGAMRACRTWSSVAQVWPWIRTSHWTSGKLLYVFANYKAQWC